VREKRLCWALVAAWLLVAPLALAQERQELSLGGGAAPVTVLADRVENLDREHLLVAEGDVQIQQGEVRLEADRLEVNTETGEAVASGRVVLFDGRDRLTGQRLEYNLRTGTGIVYQGQGAAEPHFFFGGERMERFGDKAYRIQGGVFTTCEDESPAWHVRMGTGTAYLDDWLYGTNASFWVWKVPVVPFIPFFAASLRRDRHTGFLVPTFGNSSTKGFFVGLPFFWAISDSQDLTLVPSYFTKRGPGLGFDFRYVRTEASRGALSGFGLVDRERDDDLRGVLAFTHEEQITPRLTLKADLGWVTDIDYFREFGATVVEQSRQRLESTVAVTHRWDKWNFVGRLFSYQDLTTEEPVELRRLPELRLNAFQQPVPGAPDLLFDLETSYNNFVRDIGSAGQRFDFHPSLSYPVSPGGLFTLTPRVGFRETVYSTRVVGLGVDRGYVVEDTVNEFTSRSLFEAGFDVEARAARVFDLGGALGIQRLLHTIEPRVTYAFVAGDDRTDLPRWDSVDVLRPANLFTYSLTNRIKAREAVDEEGKAGRVWELLRLTFSQSYNVDPLTLPASPAGVLNPAFVPTTTIVGPGTVGRRLSDLAGDFIFEPLYGIRLRATASFDPYESLRPTAAVIDATYESRDWKVTLGTRHGDGGALNFLQGAVRARLGQRWTVEFTSNYDVQASSVVENRVSVEFREQCWAIVASYTHGVDEDKFAITVNLLELGQYGFGTGFGGTGSGSALQ
jgi:LPS-assembly protein